MSLIERKWEKDEGNEKEERKRIGSIEESKAGRICFLCLDRERKAPQLSVQRPR